MDFIIGEPIKKDLEEGMEKVEKESRIFSKNEKSLRFNIEGLKVQEVELTPEERQRIYNSMFKFFPLSYLNYKKSS